MLFRSGMSTRTRTWSTAKSIAATLLGMLVDPFELTYDRGSRRLLRFTGVSNLKDEAGQSQQVDIHYQYPEELEQRDG